MDIEPRNPKKKIRITLDVSREFYERLEYLEKKIDAESKAHLIMGSDGNVKPFGPRPVSEAI